MGCTFLHTNVHTHTHTLFLAPDSLLSRSLRDKSPVLLLQLDVLLLQTHSYTLTHCLEIWSVLQCPEWRSVRDPTTVLILRGSNWLGFIHLVVVKNEWYIDLEPRRILWASLCVLQLLCACMALTVLGKKLVLVVISRLSFSLFLVHFRQTQGGA